MFIVQLGTDELEAVELWRQFVQAMVPAINDQRVAYMAAQPELATTGQYHIQGYLVWPSRRNLAITVKEFHKIWTGPHASFRTKSKHSTVQECIDYCTEEGGREDFSEACPLSFLEDGDRPEEKKQGLRTDLLEFKGARRLSARLFFHLKRWSRCY